ncbi:MAG TPA: hypothetical protein VGN14_11490, partial [Candidatus Elarobacter sp.]
RFLIGIIAWALAVGGTASADPPQPSRTVVYDVTSTQHCSHNLFGPEHATLTVTILGGFADGGLAVRVAFTGEGANQLPFQLAIAPDGRLAYNPEPSATNPLCPAVALVVPPLAVGLVDGRRIAVGQTWTVPARSTSRLYGTTWYHVDTVNGTHAVIVITDPGRARPLTGTMAYATDTSLPLSIDLDSIIGHVTATLRSDSLASR